MYAITGITGHVGRAAADELLSTGAAVRAVVRDEARGAPWRERGADVAVADFTDRAALATALRGCDGAFVMLPTVATGGDAYHRTMADTIAAAVDDSGVPHVVVLSAYGADLADGTGPIRWLHHLENRLRDTGARVTVVRSPHFQEKVEELLGPVLGAGVYPVFGDSADVPTPMVATRDIGAVVARSLRSPTGDIVDLDAPHYTEREVAGKLAAVLGRPVQVVTVPEPGWTGALVDAGLPAAFAAELAALYAAEKRGLLVPRGDRTVACGTPIDDLLPGLVPANA